MGSREPATVDRKEGSGCQLYRSALSKQETQQSVVATWKIQNQ